MSSVYDTSGPHIHSQDSISRTMWTIAIALAPAAAAAVYLFGLVAVYLIFTSALASVLIEFPFARSSYSRRQPLGDGSAFIAGMILGLSLSPASAWWVPIVGAFLLVVVGKQVFGGLGNNIFNPALVARAILLLSWPDQLTRWHMPFDVFSSASPMLLRVDALTGATPLAGLDAGYGALFLGTIPGSLGETSAIALLVGAAFLLARGLITWRVPVSVLIGAVAGALLFGLDPLFTILSGSLLFAAIFMATDMVTSPTGKTSHLIFGFGCGFLTVFIRRYTAYPAGVTFAFLIMNSLAYLLDRIGADPIFGQVELRNRRVYRALIVVGGMLALGVILGGAFLGSESLSRHLANGRLRRDVRAIYPHSDRIVAVTTSDSAVEYYRVYGDRELLGHYASVFTNGYGGSMRVEAGLDQFGAISALNIAEDQESPTLGTRIRSESFLSQFIGWDMASREAMLDTVEVISGATVSSRSVVAAVEKILASRDERTRRATGGAALPAVSDGTYSGTGRGYQGPIAVEVTVAAGRVSAITVTSHSETEGIGTRAMSALTGQIVDQQQFPTDAISGATGTSGGFRAALADALGAE